MQVIGGRKVDVQYADRGEVVYNVPCEHVVSMEDAANLGEEASLTTEVDEEDEPALKKVKQEETLDQGAATSGVTCHEGG